VKTGARVGDGTRQRGPRAAPAQLFGGRVTSRVMSPMTCFGTSVRLCFTFNPVRRVRPAVLPTFDSVFGPKNMSRTTATMSQWIGLTLPMGAAHYTEIARLGYLPPASSRGDPSMRSPFGFVTAVALVLALTLPGCSRRAGPGGGPAGATSTPSATASAKPPRNELVDTGAALYLRYCELCHGKDATGYAADNAPSLVTRTFLESADDAFIAKAIQVGRPSTAMGAYGKDRGGPLDNSAIGAIVAFLRARGPAARPLPQSPPHGNPVQGAALYQTECASCHGTETERKTALSLYNPELLAAASPAFLRYAITNGRAPTPMPAFSDKLSPSAIEDVVTYLAVRGKASAPPSAGPIGMVPANLPVVINPKGRPPVFTLREERFVSAAEVKKALDERRRIVIVDARSPADWVAYHIPGAISAPYYQAAELERIPNDGTWVIAYCACPHHASGAIVDALRTKGYKHTAVLDEGILVWKSNGYPLDGASTK
jgi:cytochrome c oxidase cbb3-type subunit 3